MWNWKEWKMPRKVRSKSKMRSLSLLISPWACNLTSQASWTSTTLCPFKMNQEITSRLRGHKIKGKLTLTMKVKNLSIIIHHSGEIIKTLFPLWKIRHLAVLNLHVKTHLKWMLLNNHNSNGELNAKMIMTMTFSMEKIT